MRRMRRMHKILLGMVALAAVLVVALGVAISTLDLNAYKAEATQRFAAATGRDLHIDGAVELELSLIPSIALEGVRIANADWGTEPDMLRVARAEARLALLPLLMGDVRIHRLALFSPTILVEKDVRGVSNWDLRAGQAPTEAGAPASGWQGIALDELEIRNAGLTLRDDLTGETTAITIGEITLATDGPGTPVSVTIAADVDGRAITAGGTLGKSGQLFANEPIAVDLDVITGATTLAIDGNVARPLQGEGLDLGLALRSTSLADLGQFTGGDWPAAGPIELTGQLTDTERGHALNGFELRMAGSDLSGSLNLERGARPRLTGRLYAERIDLAALLATRHSETRDQGRLFSPAPLPLGTLAAVDADITLDARRVDTGNATLENLETRFALDHGRLRLEPFTAGLAGGRMAAVTTLTASGDGTARMELDLDIAQLEPGRLPALRDLVTGATTDVTFEAEGAGASMAAIMATLDGRLLAQSGPGTLNNSRANAASSDLLLETYRLLDPTAKRDVRTQLECAVFHFTIRDGVAITDRGIALATARMNVIGSGVIDLDSERLDIGITTQAREGLGLSAGQFADLVRLGGTLGDPQPTLDTGKTVMTGVSAGAAVATSGLSIVAQGLYDRLTADDAPCETALAMRIRDTRSTGDKAADAVKGVGDAIKGAFENIFGN